MCTRHAYSRKCEQHPCHPIRANSVVTQPNAKKGRAEALGDASRLMFAVCLPVSV